MPFEPNLRRKRTFNWSKRMLSVRWVRLLPFLAWPLPGLVLLKTEALAGLTVGLMVIPQGVAYAALAGMPLVTGIYASLLPALVAVLFSSSVRLSVGPTALSCLLISASLNGLAVPGSTEWVNLAVWLALLSGVVQVLLGVGRFGWFLNLVSAPVLMAFTQAAAVLIIASQLPDLLGWRGDVTELSTTHFVSFANWDILATAYGLLCLGILSISRRWKPAFPTVLLLVLLAAATSMAFQFEGRGGAVVGLLPQGMPALQWPRWPGWSTLVDLLLPVLVITLISFLETAASAKVDNARQGTRWNQNQDLIGQGVGKLAAAFSGTFPTSSSFSRSALNLYAGARSGWATVFSVAVVGLSLLWFLPVLHHVPQAVLAAIVVVAVIGLIRPVEFVKLWRISRVEAFIAAVTFAVTVMASPRLYWGVLAGVMLALVHFLYQRLHPRIIELGLHADGRLRDRHLWRLPAMAPNTYVLRMDAALDFGSANALEQDITDHLTNHPQTRRVVLFAQAINRIDATGVEAFARLRQQLTSRHCDWEVVGLKLPAERVLEAAGCLQPGSHFVLHVSEVEAMRAITNISNSAIGTDTHKIE
jgi:SulP family sulfate permease